MATILTKVQFATNVDELRKSLLTGIETVDAMKRAVDRTSAAIGGAGLFASTNKAAAAIASLGGVTKLTAAEQAKINTQFEKAIEKATLMGQTIPPVWREIAASTKQAAQQTEDFTKKTATLSERFTKIGSAARTVGVGLSAAITAPLVGAAIAAAKVGIDFESAFAGVRKTVTASEPEFLQMAQSFRTLAKTIPVSVNELAKLGETAGALGIPKQSIVEFSKVMAQLGVTTNLTSDQAAESIAKIQNIFGAAGKETENFASTLVALGNAGASTESEITELAKRIAGAGNTIGLSQSQVLGFSAAIADVGIEAEAGGSAISRVFTELAIAVSKGGAAVEKFARVAGVSVAEFSRLFKADAAEATTRFIEGLGRIKASGGDLIGTLETLGFTELRQSDLLRRLAGNSDNVRGSLERANVAWRDNTALAKEAEQRFKTTASQLTLLWNRVKDVGITLFTALKPAIDSALSGFNRLLPVVERMATSFADMPKPMQLAGIGIAGMAAVAGPALVALGGLAFTITQVSAALVAFPAIGIAASGAMAALTTGALGIAATAVGVIAAAAAVLGLSYALTRLIDVASGGKLSGWLTPFIAGTNDLKLATQEAGAGADAMALAIARGGTNIRNAADALAYNTKWLKEHNQAAQEDTKQHDAIALASERSGKAVHYYSDALAINTKWEKEHAAASGVAATAANTLSEKVKALTAEQRAQILAEYASTGSMKAAAAAGQVATEVASAFLHQQKAVTKTQNEVAKAHEAVRLASVPLTASQLEVATSLIELNEAAGGTIISIETIAKEAKAAPVQIRVLKAALDDAAKAVVETDKRMAAFEATGVSAAQEIGKSFAGMPQVLRGLAQAMGTLNLDAKQLPPTGLLIGSTYADATQMIAKGMTEATRATLKLNSEQKALIDHLYKLGYTTSQIATTLNIPLASVEQHVHGVSNAVLDLGQAFAQLGQIAGGTFGTMLVAIPAAIKAFQAYREIIKSTTSDLAKHQAKMQLIGGLITLGATTFAQATANSTSTKGQVAHGAAQGAAVGASIGFNPAVLAATGGASAVLGPMYGALIGAIVGYVKSRAEWVKLGKDIGAQFGISLSKETLKAWEQESKQFGRQATTILHLDEIIAAAGGIAKFGFDKATAGAFDLFSLMKQGKLTVAQVAGELDKLWPSLAQGGTDAYGRISDKLKELIRLNHQYGTESKEIAAFQKQQGSNVISGFNATVDVLGTSTKGGVEFSKIAADVKTAKDAVDALVKDGKKGTREWEEAVKKLTEAQAIQKKAAVESKEALDDLGVQALGAYAAAVATGASEAEALAHIAPSLKTLRESYKNLGLDVEDVGVKALLMQDAILNGTGKLGAGVNGLNQEFVALDNLGLLNAETFASLQRTGERMFERLQAAAIENGGTQKDALIPMQQFLHQAADAAEKYGYKLDDATQAMIDASKAQGIWKDKPDPTKDLNQGLKDLIQSVKDLIDALRGIPPKVKTEVEVNTRHTDDGNGPDGSWRDPGNHPPPRSPAEGASTGGIVRPWGIQHFADGGHVLPFLPRGRDIVPAMLTPGELVLNDQQQARLGALLDGRASMTNDILTATGTYGRTSQTPESTGPRPIVEQIFELDGQVFARRMWDPEIMSGKIRERARATVRQMDKER